MRRIRPLLLVLLAGLAAGPSRADGPDRSTPEAAYRAFLEADQDFQEEVRAFLLVEVRRIQEVALAPLGSRDAARRYRSRTALGRQELDEARPRWDVEFDGREDGGGKDLVVQHLRRVHVRSFLETGGRLREVRTERRERIAYVREGGDWRIQERALGCIECAGTGERALDVPCAACGGKGLVPEAFGIVPDLALPASDPPDQPPAPDRTGPEAAARSYLAAASWAHARVMAGYGRLLERGIEVYDPFYASERVRRFRERMAEVRTRGTALFAGLESGIERVESPASESARAIVWARRARLDGTNVEERLRLTLVVQEGEWRFKAEDPECDSCGGTGSCPDHPAEAPAGSCRFCEGVQRCRTCRGEGFLKGSSAGEHR